VSEWKGVSVLVTGGAGFIGSNLVEKLVQLGAKVRVLDDFSTGKRENIAHLLKRGAIELIEGSLTEPEVVKRAVSGIEFVFHQGAIPSVVRSVEDPLTTHQVNTTGTLLLLLTCRDAGVRRVIFASSSSVYGDTPTLPKREDMTPNPKSPYALSKLVGEHLCRLFWELYGLETVSLRYFNIFGPRQDPTSHFTFVENCVQANLLAATKPNIAGEVFNVGAGKQTSVNELFRLIRSLVGADHIEPIYAPPRPGDVRHSLADITKARQLLGYEPSVSLEEGLRITVEWFRRNAGS
jgi:UDP-glucose 4-epimerase